MTGRRAPLLGALLLLGASAPARAETVDQAYAAALQDYYAGRYQRAVESFERVLALPMRDADLHFNLGCAYFKLGRLGHAIYHFEQALALDPSAEDAGFNLHTVRAMVATRVKDEVKGAELDPLRVRLVSALRQTGWAALFLPAWWLAFGLLVLLRYVRSGPARSGIVAGSCFAGLLAVVFGLLLLGRIYLDDRVSLGIVLPDSMAVREGPDAGTKASFRVHAGLRVRVQARSGAWVRIRLSNGLEGWAQQREIGML